MTKESYGPLCGVIASYVILKEKGCSVDFETLKTMFEPIPSNGVSFSDIQKVLARYGINSYIESISSSEQNKLNLVGIVRENRDESGTGHFFVSIPLGDDRVQCVDPPYRSVIESVANRKYAVLLIGNKPFHFVLPIFSVLAGFVIIWVGFVFWRRISSARYV